MGIPINFKDGRPSREERRQKRADSPGPSCVSMKSDGSMGIPPNLKDGRPSREESLEQQERADSPGPSCVSMKSDRSMHKPPDLKDGRPSREERHQERSKVTSAQSVQQHHTELEMNQEELADTLWGESAAVECQPKFKSRLKKKLGSLDEGITQGEQRPLNEIYTELYITERGSGEVNQEHEVRLIETASRKPAMKETPIRCKDIFKPSPGQDQPDKPIRTIMTTGVAGIGKTVLTQKFTLDWAEDKANQDIHFTFLLTFRELNLLKGKEFSLEGLVHHFFIETKEAEICRFHRYKVVFILDGLDECRLPLDFQNIPICTDVTKSTSVDVLLTNLIKGNLLPSARIWITTRPAAANQILAECVDRVTEVRGFTDSQKEEYFRKRFRDEALANTIISHVKKSRSLHIIEERHQERSKVTHAQSVQQHHTELEMNQEELADTLWGESAAVECQPKFKSRLKKKLGSLDEGITQGEQRPLNEIYTELYITERGSGEVNQEHEVRLIETASRKPAMKETPIRCEDIFKPSPGQDQPDKPIRTIMTTGVAGIGKTVLTQKFTLDWAEDKANHDIDFTFHFTFRDLNLLKGEEFSLVKLLHRFFIETKEEEICRYDPFQVVFILDGLDECRLPLDFQKNPIWTDVTESTSVDVLLTNLIRGDLLPSARIWITTRPAAANRIPAECVDMVTEVRGFTDPQKEDYFRKRFREETANTIISHVKKSRSLHIMCHIPVFCWITAKILEDILKTHPDIQIEEMPKTVTQMYSYFLWVQSIQGDRKYHGRAGTDPYWGPESKKIIVSLGKLAFNQLEKGNLIFYEADLEECHIDIEEASEYSGVFTKIFKEECGMFQDKVFCFVHLSLQEFLAALYVFLTFINDGVNLLSEEPPTSGEDKLLLLYQSAVDKALQSENGQLDLFLRFLLGLSLETNQIVLRGLLGQRRISSPTNKETVLYIKKKIGEDLSPERSINLFHCLNELNDHSLVDQIQQSLTSGSLFKTHVSPAQWSALVFILLSSEEELDVFDLKKYKASQEGLLRLLPVVKASKTSLLNGCNLSKRCCEALASVLSSSSSLREMDLSSNDLQDSGVKLLSAGLGSSHCTLETLSLSGCLVTQEGCASLASALSSNPSHLRELDLSYNHPGDSGAALLSAGLEDPRWRLDTLSVEHGGVWRLKPAHRQT
ncbi:unnamed protein product [Arctogadus glacialis]